MVVFKFSPTPALFYLSSVFVLFTFGKFFKITDYGRLAVYPFASFHAKLTVSWLKLCIEASSQMQD